MTGNVIGMDEARLSTVAPEMWMITQILSRGFA